MPEFYQTAEFMKWAAEISAVNDWMPEERPYKMELADRLAVTRNQLLADNTDWFQLLLDDLSRGNLLDWRFRDALKLLGNAHSDGLFAAVRELWVHNPSPAGLTDFVNRIRHLDSDQKPGNLLSLGSLLLMAAQPPSFPPYRAETAATFLRLLGANDNPSNREPASERYDAFLSGLDEVLVASRGAGLDLADRLDAQGLVWVVLNCSPPEDWTPDRRRQFLNWRNHRSSEEVDEHQLRTGPYPLLEKAAATILGPGIAGGPSPFDPDVVTWTAENAQEIYRRTYANPDEGEGSFMEKLAKQLDGADRGVLLLAAELITLQCLPLVNLRPETKITRISTVLSWADLALRIPATVEAGLRSGGAFHGGTGFNLQLWRHLSWMCELVISLRESDENAEAATASPQGLQRVASALDSGVPSMRYTLEYLAWPGFFEPMINGNHRWRIRNAFAHEIQGASGDDDLSIATDLYLIRKAIEEREGERVEWYEEPYLSQWKPGVDPAPRAWLVRQAQSGVSLASRWAQEDFVSLEAHSLGAPEAGASLPELQAAVDAGYPHLDYSERLLRSRAYHFFLSQMKPEDLVVTVHGSQLRLGVITGDPEYRQDEIAGLLRSVAWQDSSILAEELPAPFPQLLEEQGIVVDMTEALPLMKSWINPDPSPAPDPVVPGPAISGLAKISDDLAVKLHMDRDDLQEVVDLLQSRNQVVFYGPPGTGKTFLAGKLARYLAGDENHHHVMTVQFHPSYAYEDFFEGYRPVKGADGQVSFAIVSGPLRRIARAAAAERDKPFFLIIDEMNRGNLAKVFGELYFLLEYRDQIINLQYNSEEKFALPPNLFIIGTMNTADRSIAMVDAAIRRRFAFVELHPQEGMSAGLLERFLEARSMDSRPAKLLDALNAEISAEDRDIMIGPSYFMKEHAFTPAGLRQVWKYELMPLLEEHYYGRWSRPEIHARFGLEAIEQKVDGSAAGL